MGCSTPMVAGVPVMLDTRTDTGRRTPIRAASMAAADAIAPSAGALRRRRTAVWRLAGTSRSEQSKAPMVHTGSTHGVSDAPQSADGAADDGSAPMAGTLGAPDTGTLRTAGGADGFDGTARAYRMTAVASGSATISASPAQQARYFTEAARRRSRRSALQSGSATTESCQSECTSAALSASATTFMSCLR